MILRYPPQQQTNSSSCSSYFPSEFDSPLSVMNSNTNNSNSNFRLSFIHHSTDIENETNNSLMNDEPCTPCSSWLSLTSLHQLSFNNLNDLSSTATSCTISSNLETQLMPPPPSQSTPNSNSNSSSNISAKDLFEEEFLKKCSKYRKVNEATRSVSSLTPCSTSSSKSVESNDKDIDSTTTETINVATATIVSKVLSNVLSKSVELKQKKIQKRSGIKRQDIPRLVIPNDQSSAIFVKHCSLNGKKQ